MRILKAKVLEPASPNKATALFGGESSGILNWNDVPHPHFYELREEIRGLFWRAGEIDMSQDIKQFPTLPKRTQESFLTILGGMLSSLDAPQTDIAVKISQYATDPSIRSIFATIGDQESEHNHSYSYVLASVVKYEDQIHAFEQGRINPIVLERNDSLQKIYNEFSENPTIENVLKVLVYSGVLEGLFFYSAFAFFYNLARNNKMVGTSTMISYINRDELHHFRVNADVFRATLAQNPAYNNEEFIGWVYDAITESVDKEVAWSKYILKGIEGIDLVEMEGYIKYRANKMLRMYGLEEVYEEYVENPMKWIRAYADNFDDTKTDFFEQKNRQYAKVGQDNGFAELMNEEGATLDDDDGFGSLLGFEDL